MSLTSHTLHESALLRIRCVCCRPHEHGCGAVEQAQSHTLALPLNGVFLKYHEGGPEVVASAGQALFFNAGEAYRVSHPAGAGDDCLSLEPSAQSLREMLECFDAAAAEREDQPFRATHAALPAPISLQHRLLWQGLRQGNADALEIDTRSLDLFGAVLASARPAAPRATDRRPQARRRRREQAQATAVTLAARPENGWTLDELSRRVHASPFHLARSFQQELGDSIHQYLLRARLARALHAVLDSRGELTGIAMQLGFSTPSHFSAAFRKAYGLTPSALRRQAKGGTVREMRKMTAEQRG